MSERSDSATDQALTLAAYTDPAAFTILYERYVARIYRYVASRVGNDEAADITQQIFLQAWQSLASYHVDRSFGSWLFGVARRVLADAHRQQRPTITWDLVPDGAHPLDGASNPETVALRNETHTHMHRLLQRLDPDKREVLALYSAGQLSIAEIAVIVGKRPEAVKKQLARTLKALREQYHATE